jgi:hypothetical protein
MREAQVLSVLGKLLKYCGILPRFPVLTMLVSGLKIRAEL